MAKIQMTVEELLQMSRGELPIDEMKENLAKAILDVWDSQFMQGGIEEKAQAMATKKVQRAIESAFREEESGWGSNKKMTIKGWATPLIAESMSKTTFEMVSDFILSKVESKIHEIVQQSISNILMGHLVSKTEGKE